MTSSVYQSAQQGVWRRRIVAPAVMLMAAGILGGASEGTATAEVAEASSADAAARSASNDFGSHWWTLTNNTALPVWGRFLKEQGDMSSAIGFTPDMPLSPHGSAHVQQYDTMFYREYTQGDICFAHSWFNLPRANYHGDSLVLDGYLSDPAAPSLAVRIFQSDDPGGHRDWVALTRGGNC